MPNGPRSRRLLLIVDQDLDFVEDMRLLLRGERLLSARSLDEAVEIAEGGRVDVAVLGPSFGHEAGVLSAAELLEADPSAAVILVANVLTTRVLRAALRVGLLDVIDTPVTIRKLQAALGRLPVPPEHLSGRYVEIDEREGDVTSSLWEGGAQPAGDRVVLEPVAVPGPAAEPDSPPRPEVVPEPAAEPEKPPENVAAPEPVAIPEPVVEPEPDPGGVPGPEPIRVPGPDPSTFFDDPEAWAIPVPDIPARLPAAAGPPSSPGPRQDADAEPSGEAPGEPSSVVDDEVPDPDPGGMVELTVEPIPEPAEPPPEHAAFAPPSPRHSPLRRPPDAQPAVAMPRGAPPMPTEAPPMPADVPAMPERPAEQRRIIGLAAPDPAGVVDEVFGPERRRRVRQPGDGRVVAVMAGKGGSGKTVIAVNLAVALVEAVGREAVALVDADLQFGDVALLLQLDPSATIAEVAPQSEAVGPEKLESLLTRHDSGLRVLPAPLIPSRAAVAPKQVVNVIERLQRRYEFVVVDTSAVFDDTLFAVLDAADDVLVVVDMDIPSVKNAKIALDTLRAADYPMERMRLVINRVNSKSRLNVIEVERSLGMRVAASLPSDRVVPQSVNEGIPVVALSPRSRVARAFRSLVSLVSDAPVH